jgi:hypothetical protein
LLDLASLLVAAGQNPVATFDREADEKPEHNPLADARQTARILCKLLSAKSPA